MSRLTKNSTAFESIKKRLLSGVTSINDLKDLYYQGKPMSKEQENAIKNFDAIRLEILKKQATEAGYNKQYLQFQVMSNLYNYTEFL